MALSKTPAIGVDSMDVLIPEDLEEIDMGIDPAAMAHIIARLTDMYPDPVDATVREIVSNATDATRKLPPEDRLPILITTPTTFNPMFVVEDRGIGMSLETVRTKYPFYGGTTKQLDFNAIGAYGLGAKSPLAYCSEFNVSTTHEGVTVDLLITRESTGNKTKIINIRETDQRNGTIVSIPARTNDRQRFIDALHTYKHYAFDTEIEIDGELNTPDSGFVEFTNIVLEEESGLTGRVWVHENSITRLLENAVRDMHPSTNVRYSLSGWVYNPPKDSNRLNNGVWGKAGIDVIVELKPGVVDFSSGRDEITANERSEALNKRVAESVVKMSDYLMENVLRVYRDFDHKTALNFIQNFNNSMIVKDGIVSIGDVNHRTGAITAVVENRVEDFTLNSGFNPINYLLGPHTKDIRSVVLYGDASSGYCALVLEKNGFFKGISTWSPEGAEQKRYYHRQVKPRVSETNSHVAESFAKEESQLSFTEFFGHAIRLGVSKDFVVVTGADSEKIAKINKLRSTISNLYPNSTYMMFAASNGVNSKDIALAKEIEPNRKIETISADTLIDNAVSYQKEARKAAKADRSTADDLHNFYIVEHELKGVELTESAFVKSFRGPRTSVRKTFSEIIAEGGIIVLSAGDSSTSVSEVLTGALNDGLDVLNRSVYCVAYVRDLNASHYNMLAEYEYTFAHPSWSYNCKSAEKIKDTRTYQETTLKSEIMALTDEAIIWRYILGTTYSYTKTLEHLTEFLPEEFHKVVKAANTTPENERELRWSYGKISKKIIEEKLGVDEFDRLRALGKSLTNSSHPIELESRLLNEVLRYSDNFELTDLTRPIVKKIADGIVRNFELIKEKRAADETEATESEAAKPEEV